jgi:hypothetical protein
MRKKILDWLDQAILSFVAENPGVSTAQVMKRFEGVRSDGAIRYRVTTLRLHGLLRVGEGSYEMPLFVADKIARGEAAAKNGIVGI